MQSQNKNNKASPSMSTAPSFKKSKLADRGKSAENAVDKYLKEWQLGSTRREFTRLLDSKAAGRIIKASAADFEYFSSTEAHGVFGLIEVKQTEHLYRLERPKLPQLARMRKRTKCGGSCYVLVFHSAIEQWRVVDITWLANNGDLGSWNLTDFPLYEAPGDALISIDRSIFY